MQKSVSYTHLDVYKRQVYCGGEIGWQSVIDGRMNFMQAESLEDAKKEMIDILVEHFTYQINYYHDLQDSLEELNDREV